jgi:hypothetical protein
MVGNLVGRDPGEDVAYIARPGTTYRTWITDKWRASCASFVGMPFKTVDEALEAISREFKATVRAGPWLQGAQQRPLIVRCGAMSRDLRAR